MTTRWRAAVEKELKGASIDSLVATLPGGLRIDPLYEDRPSPPVPRPFPESSASHAPGPGHGGATGRFRVGALLADTTTMAEMRAWLDAEARGGTEAVLVEPEVCADPRFPHLLDSLPPKEVALHASVGASVAAASSFASWAAGRGDEVSTFGLDPIGAYARDGSPEPGQIDWRAIGAFAAEASGRPLLVSAEPYHDAGADPASELAYALSTTAEMLRRLEQPAALVTRRLTWRFAVGRELLAEIAKLRAARILWRKLSVACHLDDVDPGYLVAVTSSRTLSRRDPWVNALRGTTQAFAAIVAGADVIAVRPYDSALGVPDSQARRLARNTLLVLRHESRLDEVLDPARGAYAIEHLTDRLARSAWDRFRSIERDGGMIARLRTGTVKDELAARWDEWLAGFGDKRFPIIGVTEFPNEAERPLTRALRQTLASSLPDRPCPLPRHRDAAAFERAVTSADGSMEWAKS